MATSEPWEISLLSGWTWRWRGAYAVVGPTEWAHNLARLWTHLSEARERERRETNGGHKMKRNNTTTQNERSTPHCGSGSKIASRHPAPCQNKGKKKHIGTTIIPLLAPTVLFGSRVYFTKLLHRLLPAIEPFERFDRCKPTTTT